MPKPPAAALIAALSLATVACDVHHDHSVTENPAEPVSSLDEIASAVETLMDQGRVPGASIAMIRNGELVGARGLGLADASAGTPVTAETLFEAASLSKPVFAYMVLKLAERGELDLDRPLSEILPHPDLDDPRRDQLTARQVLSHTTGLPNWRPGRWSDNPEPLVLSFDPGSRFSYSGEGFEYLRRVVEKLTGSGLEDLATREIFEPLGMSSTKSLELNPENSNAVAMLVKLRED